MRIGKTPTVFKLATGVPRDWDVPAAFWSCGQMKTFLVRGPSCFLCTLPQDPHATLCCICAYLYCLTSGPAKGARCEMFYCVKSKVLSAKNSMFRQGVRCCCLLVLSNVERCFL